MKTINATLADAMVLRKGQPIARWKFQQWSGSVWGSAQIRTLKAYEFNENILHIILDSSQNTPTTGTPARVQVERGLHIAGTDYYEASPMYYLSSYKTDNFKKEIELFCEPLPEVRITNITASNTAETVIDNLLAPYADPEFLTYTEAWRSWQFMKSGKTINFNSLTQLQPLLKQKYFVSTVPGRNGPLFFNFGLQYINGSFTPPTITGVSLSEIVKDRKRIQAFTFIWQDENNVVHITGTGATRNLGFIPSSVASTTVDDFDDTQTAGEIVTQINPNLAIENGDTYEVSTAEQGLPFIIREKFAFLTSIWEQRIVIPAYPPPSTANLVQSNSQPAISNTFLDTSTFGDILSDNENNPQSAFELLDRTTVPAITGKTAAPTANDDINDGYIIRHIWIDETNDDAYICLNNAAAAAVWKKITP